MIRLQRLKAITTPAVLIVEGKNNIELQDILVGEVWLVAGQSNMQRLLRETANGEQAIAAGVFGVPSAVVDNRCFWGVDATDMLLAYLRGDPFFQSAQLARAQNLPQGVHRK